MSEPLNDGGLGGVARTGPGTPPAAHIGCQFNHAHRWPDCYDEAYEPDIFDRLMSLWQKPWSEQAFGEAQALIARLRAMLARPTATTGLGGEFGLEDEDPAAAIAEASLREWWDDLTPEEQWEAFRIEKDNSDSQDSLASREAEATVRRMRYHPDLRGKELAFVAGWDAATRTLLAATPADETPKEPADG